MPEQREDIETTQDGLPTLTCGSLFEVRGGPGGGASAFWSSGRHLRHPPLPSSGTVTVGRSDKAGIRIDDPSISRKHAAIHVGPPLLIEDLRSANGVRVRGQTVDPGASVPLAPGETVDLGATTMIVQRGLTARPRRLWTHGYFEARLEDECARAERSGSSFTVVRLQAEGSVPRGAVEQCLSASIRSFDLVASYAPDEYEILLVETPATEAETVVRQLAVQLAERGARVRTGLASYPRDGRTSEALVARAGAAVRGEGGAPASEERSSIVVGDRSMQHLHGLVERIAGSDISVILLGETGVGKEVLAELLHTRSPRAPRPFLRLNCAALSDSLLESELFGHERGAFTGALAAKPGLLESADGGTVFLDEVGELPLSTQVKLLRVLEDHQVMRVGGIKTRSIDVRFVAATNRDLEAMVAFGHFRQDLFFRLNGISLVIPPLRERPSEIEPLARSFTTAAARRMKRWPEPVLSAEARSLLLSYMWPGNIRELRNVIERAVLLSSGGQILLEHLPVEKMGPAHLDGGPGPHSAPYGAAPGGRPGAEVATPRSMRGDGGLPTVPPPTPSAPPPSAPRDLKSEVEALERQRIVDALERCAGNQTKAAKMLGMSRRSFLTRLESYNLPRPRKGAS
ncbi:MAG: sigma 54-interacting transcriptional regulator [Polyangiaceae bacterium]